MILDKQNILSDGVAVTADAYSDVIDMVAVGRAEKALRLEIRVITAFDTTEEDGTLDITLETDDNEAFGSAATIYTVAQLAEAALVANLLVLSIELPANCERYIRLKYNVGSHNFTAGAIDAYLVETAQQHLIASRF